MLMTILRKFTVIFLAVSLCLTTVACGGGEQTTTQATNVSQTTATTRLSDGEYPVQQASYNDGDGEYTLFLLNATPPTFSTQNLQMARLTDEQIKEGKKPYLKVENGQPILYLTEDFKIEYTHNVTETRTNPQTGQQETVVVRQQNSFWSPFAGSLAGSLAGQAIGNALFRPQYYVPPAYQPGTSVLTGYGGYGTSYNDAIQNYRTRYNEPPAVVRNQNAFRTTGNIRRTYPSGSSNVRTTTPSSTRNRATGSGYGGSTLDSSGNSNTRRKSPSGSAFGSGRSSSPSRSTGFGSRRRR
jgi:hypothetical protein